MPLKPPPVCRPNNAVPILPKMGPAVYRPLALAQPLLQPRSTALPKLETRPAPPVYRHSQSPTSSAQRKSSAEIRPSILPLRTPPSPLRRASSPSLPALTWCGPAAIQRMELPKPSAKPGAVEIAQSAHKVLSDYRPNLLKDIEAAFLDAGYNILTVRQAILTGLMAWGKDISGHSTKPGSSDQGEQGDLDRDCIAARDFLVAWVAVDDQDVVPGSERLMGGL